MCLKIFELDPAIFLSAPGLAWDGALKKKKVKLDLLIDIKHRKRYQWRNMSVYLSICKRYMKDYDKNKELSYIKY